MDPSAVLTTRTTSAMARSFGRVRALCEVREGGKKSVDFIKAILAWRLVRKRQANHRDEGKSPLIGLPSPRSLPVSYGAPPQPASAPYLPFAAPSPVLRSRIWSQEVSSATPLEGNLTRASREQRHRRGQQLIWIELNRISRAIKLMFNSLSPSWSVTGSPL